MEKKVLYLLLGILQFSFAIEAQDNDIIKAINNGVWQPYLQSFERMDADLFASVHAHEMVCIEADAKTIKELKPYVEGYREWFEDVRKTGGALKLSVRFFERIHTSHTASERGYYQMKMIDRGGEETIFYGQFHYLLKKKGDKWRIVMDYDTSEGKTVTKDHFNNAIAIDDNN